VESGFGTTPGPFAEHFDGTTWSVVSTAAVTNANLRGVAGVASNDVWAVGSVNTVVQAHKHTTTITSALIEHWDGTTWSAVPSPTPTNGGTLGAVKAIASNDVWAAGTVLDSTGAAVAALVEHWDGANWMIVSSPAFTGVSTVGTISADASNDVWIAAGANLLHFDGASWSLVNPNTGVIAGGVDSLSPTNVWAVGEGRDSDFDSNFARIEHWDGTSWTIVPSPRVNPAEPLDTQSDLAGIAAISANDIWAVGEALNQTITEHWDGKSWSVIASPDPGKFNVLLAVTALSDGTVAAVGYQTDFAGHLSGIILQNAAPAPKNAIAFAPSTRTMQAPLDAAAVDQIFGLIDTSEQSLSITGHKARPHQAAANGDLDFLRGDHPRP
jgi:hypothetical protein